MDDNGRRPPEGKKVRFKSSAGANKKGSIIWILTVTFLSFFISATLNATSSAILEDAEILTAFFVVFVIILINIIFDTIGTAVTAAEEAPFHAMASRKYYGAKQAIRLIRHADKVSNVCNDVVGDICGIISGAAGTYIIFRIIGDSDGISAVELIITGIITALTVGGKALGKTIAMRNSNYIIYKVSTVIKFITDKFSIFKRKGKQTNNGKKKQKNNQRKNKDT